MAQLIYDVSVSIDGFISGPNDDISAFPNEGRMVEDYLARLPHYTVALMGRCTYEFGYRFGMQPGDNPYPHMRSIVCSQSLQLPDNSSVEVVQSCAVAFVKRLKRTEAGLIYLCGGGALAGSLANAGLIDEIRIKRPAIILGTGTPLFGSSGAELDLNLLQQVDYDDGHVFQRFAIRTTDE